jgi:hypothetical protein
MSSEYRTLKDIFTDVLRAPSMPTPSTESDPTGKSQHEPGAKLDSGKVLPWLCISGFAHALTAIADVTTKGAQKYTPNGWVTVPNGEERYMEAFGRHMMALGRGETVDPDTQCLHKAQMIWNLLASLELELRKAAGWERSSYFKPSEQLIQEILSNRNHGGTD